MSIDFESARRDFETWKTGYVKKTPGSKDRVSRLVLVQQHELESLIQNEVIAANQNEVQRYVFVGKCTGERGFNGIIADLIPKTPQFQQVKAAVSLFQAYIVDLETVSPSYLGCTEDAVLRRLAGDWSLNAAPLPYRYVFAAVYATNDSLNGAAPPAAPPAPVQGRPTTAPVQRPNAPAPRGNAVQQKPAANAADTKPPSRPVSSNLAPQSKTQQQQPHQQPAAIQTRAQPNAASKGVNGTAAVAPVKQQQVGNQPPGRQQASAAAPLGKQQQQQPAQPQATRQAQPNGKPAQAQAQAYARPGTAPAQTAVAAPNARNGTTATAAPTRPQNRRF